MNTQQKTDAARALAASKAQQARIKREKAAAPELLACLIYLRDCAESGELPTPERWAQVQAVIKQAAGDTP